MYIPLTCRHWTGLVVTCAGTVLGMTDAWKEAGRIGKLRRERIGLKQEDLRLYGGPKVSTVGKFERGTQAQFPTRTQHQIENALGWPRGSIDDIRRTIEDGNWEFWKNDYEERLVEDDIPDLSAPVDLDRQVRRASELSDDELLAELTYRIKKYASELGGGDGHADDAGGSPSTKPPEAGPANQPVKRDLARGSSDPVDPDRVMRKIDPDYGRSDLSEGDPGEEDERSGNGAG